MIIERLRRELAMVEIARNAVPTPTRRRPSSGPRSALCDEFSASDGDIFPYRFKTLRLGKVIGKRTWGGVVGIRGTLPLLDGGSLNKPEFAPYDEDGKSWIIEGHGVEPDIVVDNDPAKEYAGIDEQLNKAIEVILEELKTKEKDASAHPAVSDQEVEMADEKVKVVCLECGATNLFPLAEEGKKVVCGRCKSLLSAPGTVLEPTDRQGPGSSRIPSLPVLVDFYSPTCGPCHMMHPVVERLAKRRAGDLMVDQDQCGTGTRSWRGISASGRADVRRCLARGPSGTGCPAPCRRRISPSGWQAGPEREERGMPKRGLEPLLPVKGTSPSS